MRFRIRLVVAATIIVPSSAAQVVAPLSFGVKSTATPPLIPDATGIALANELSGSLAKRNIEYITRLHRMRASKDFRTAAEFVATQARAYGLEDVKIHEIPADGHTMYGTQRSRPAWDAEFAELWEVKTDGAPVTPVTRIASFADEPVILAEDSDSANVTTELVDAGVGGSDRDYAGKDVKGKIVLISGPLTDAAPLAIDKYGAKGMLSDMPNQVTAWWKEDQTLIRWGHLDAFEPRHTFAFMLNQNQAHALSERLANGEHITLHAIVHAARHPAAYNPVTALIPGSDRKAGRDRAQLPPRPSAPRRERQREWLRHDPRDREDDREARSPMARSRAPRAASASCGRAKWSAQWRCSTPSRSSLALQSGDAHGHGGRRPVTKAVFRVRARPAQSADVHQQCRRTCSAPS